MYLYVSCQIVKMADMYWYKHADTTGSGNEIYKSFYYLFILFYFVLT